MLPIIIEGPDGAGKTTLISHLRETFGLEQAPRFSTSLGGPVDDLIRRTWDDVLSWHQRTGAVIYDRHPLISELIYGPLVRGDVAAGFSGTTARYLMQRLYREALIVLCLPPQDVVRANVHKDGEAQMPGVVQQIDTIWSLYRNLAVQWPTPRLVQYDYTQEQDDQLNSLSRLEANIRLYIAGNSGRF